MNEENKDSSLGNYLKKIREGQGFSLQDISSKTKISLAFLENLEKEEFNSLPNEVFLKGFLRSYAKVLGLDELDVLDRFKQWKILHHAPPLPQVEERGIEKKRGFWVSLYGNEKKVRHKIVVNIVIGIVILLGGLILVLKRNAEEAQMKEMNSPSVNPPLTDPLPITPSTSIPSTSAVSPSLEVNNFPPDQKDNPSAKQPSLRLVVQAVDRSWISVVIDDELTKEFSLHPNDKVSLAAEKRFILNIGNAGGVKVSLNGKPVGPFGKKGEVVKGIKLESN